MTWCQELLGVCDSGATRCHWPLKMGTLSVAGCTGRSLAANALVQTPHLPLLCSASRRAEVKQRSLFVSCTYGKYMYDCHGKDWTLCVGLSGQRHSDRAHLLLPFTVQQPRGAFKIKLSCRLFQSWITFLNWVSVARCYVMFHSHFAIILIKL